MKKLKSIGYGLLMSALGIGIGMGYQVLTGEIPLAQFASEMKSFVGTIFVSVGGTGGILLLAQTIISGKINEYKSTVDTMVSNNEISAQNADVLKQLLTEANETQVKILEDYQAKIDSVISENKSLRDVNQELLEKIQTFMSTVANIGEETFGDSE